MSKLEIGRGRSRPNTWRSAAARRLRALAGDVETTEEAVATVVQRLLNGVDFPPTDLDSIAARLNAEIVFDEELLGSGGLERTAIGYRILCSPHQPKVRQRFTKAHEIAHVIFETTGPHCPKRGRELERLCDKISASLLIPDVVYRDVVGETPKIRRLLKLGRTCEASLLAVLIRTTELSQNCSAALFPEDEPRPKYFGQQLKWMEGYASAELSELRLICSDSPHGQTTRRLPTPNGLRLFHVEWDLVGAEQEQFILLSDLIGP